MYHTKQELEKIQKMDCYKNTVYCATFNIRSDIKFTNDTMYWPPQAGDLSIDSFKHLNLDDSIFTFLNTILSSKASNSTSSRVARLKMSLGQDLIHAVSNGIAKTPKNILFRHSKVANKFIQS